MGLRKTALNPACRDVAEYSGRRKAYPVALAPQLPLLRKRTFHIATWRGGAFFLNRGDSAKRLRSAPGISLHRSKLSGFDRASTPACMILSCRASPVAQSQIRFDVLPSGVSAVALRDVTSRRDHRVRRELAGSARSAEQPDQSPGGFPRHRRPLRPGQQALRFGEAGPASRRARRLYRVQGLVRQQGRRRGLQ
jgi:hypothetical protein